jgi:hypothetical protein
MVGGGVIGRSANQLVTSMTCASATWTAMVPGPHLLMIALLAQAAWTLTAGLTLVGKDRRPAAQFAAAR